jgi:nitroreductase
MDFATVVHNRRSIRRYSKDAVNSEVLERILDVGTRGPSAGYSQGQSFIVIADQSVMKQLDNEWTRQESALTGKPPETGPSHADMFYGAPVIIIACTNEQDYHRRYQQSDKLLPDGSEISWPVPYWYVDSGCSIMLMLLAAVNENLAACLIGVPFDVQPWRDILGIPKEVMPVGTILIGHRDPDETRRDLSHRRRQQAEYIHRERW